MLSFFARANKDVNWPTSSEYLFVWGLVQKEGFRITSWGDVECSI